jgi:hypothetical protein
MNINEHYENVRKEIAMDFGLEAGGYAPRPKLMPITIAQRINAKYPSEFGSRNLNPKAVLIANRYHSLFVVGAK